SISESIWGTPGHGFGEAKGCRPPAVAGPRPSPREDHRKIAGDKGKAPEWPGSLRGLSGGPGQGLLLEVLFERGRLIKLAGLALLDDGSQGLLQPLAGLKALRAGVAFRLEGGFALGGDDHLDEARHAGSSCFSSCFSRRAMAFCSFCTSLK